MKPPPTYSETSRFWYIDVLDKVGIDDDNNFAHTYYTNAYILLRGKRKDSEWHFKGISYHFPYICKDNFALLSNWNYSFLMLLKLDQQSKTFS